MRNLTLVFLLGVFFLCVTNSSASAFADRIVESEVVAKMLEPPQVRLIKPVEPVERKATPRIVCRDKRITPVWKQIYAEVDEELWAKIREDSLIDKCSQVVDVKYFNLDGKGPNEIVVRARHSPFCGATGNCTFWIFQKRRGRYHVILKDSDNWEVRKRDFGQILREKRNGYNRILLHYHHSVSDTGYTWYRYQDGSYVVETAKVNAWMGNNSWKMISFKEFSSR